MLSFIKLTNIVFIGELIGILFILGSIGYLNYKLAIRRGNRLLDLMNVPRIPGKSKRRLKVKIKNI